MSHVFALIMGAVLMLMLCAVVAGWVWISLERGNDRPLTEEEIMQRLGEIWQR